nr:HNH endonuclease signature motif containing protein [Brevibacterium marinum]
MDNGDVTTPDLAPPASGRDSSSTPIAGPIPDSGQAGNEIRPSRIGSGAPRRLNVDPDSPQATLLGLTTVSTAAQLLELQALAGIFLNEAIDRLNYNKTGNGDIYLHATFADTVSRFLKAEAAAELGNHDALDSCQFESDGDGNDKQIDSDEAESVKDSNAAHPLPIFPRFRLDQSFYGWIHALAETEDIVELNAVLGSTIGHTFMRITTAMVLIHGLPRFFERCLAGEFTMEHVHATARMCRDLDFEHFPKLDEHLANRRNDITIETFKKSLSMKLAALDPEEDRLEEASKRRRVDVNTYPDGTASLTLSGPAADLKAYYLRLEAFARSIRSGNITAFTDEFTTGAEVMEDRSIDALMFDICTRTRPQLSIQVTVHDTTTGETTVEELPLEVPEEKTMTSAGITTTIHEAAECAQANSEAAAGEGTTTTTSISLEMPTHGQWIDTQGKMLVTVPFLTLTGDSELPGIFSDGSPIPAETARRIAGNCSTWTRILTDKATGTPIDAKSASYSIPANLRLPLAAKWQSCTAPGCTLRAENSEVDHLIPFDHDTPDQGGLTTFMNTHYLCKPHHRAKTDKKYSVRKVADGSVEYSLKHGVVTEVAPPDNPINVEHAKLIEQIGSSPPGIPAPTEAEPPRRRKPSQQRTSRRDNGNAAAWDTGDPPPF